MFGRKKSSTLEWHALESESQLKKIITESEKQPVAVFKHSTRCPISIAAKSRLERRWNIQPDSLRVYYLDLLAQPAISQQVATTFGVQHQSPQVLLVRGGKAIFNASHSDVTVAGIREALNLQE